MLKIRETSVYFLTEEEGGIQDGFDGMRPSFNIDSDLIMCVVRSLDGLQQMPRGGTYRVALDLPFGEMTSVGDQIESGVSFRLQIASKVIATGTIIMI